MSERVSLASYYSQFVRRLVKDSSEWARDNIVVACIAAVLPALILSLRDRNKPLDWWMTTTIILVYAAMFFAYFSWHILRTPWKMDADRRTTIWLLEERNNTLQTEINQIHEVKPKIILREPGAKHVETITLSRRGVIVAIAPFVSVRFINKPTGNFPNSVARDVRAKIRFLDSSGNLVLQMDGRWSDSDQPSTRAFGSSRNDLLAIDFGIEEEHSLDIAFRDPQSGEFVAWNNDNYNYPNFKKPEHLLAGKEFTVHICLRAVWIDSDFSLKFRAGSNGQILIDD